MKDTLSIKLFSAFPVGKSWFVPRKTSWADGHRQETEYDALADSRLPINREGAQASGSVIVLKSVDQIIDIIDKLLRFREVGWLHGAVESSNDQTE